MSNGEMREMPAAPPAPEQAKAPEAKVEARPETAPQGADVGVAKAEQAPSGRANAASSSMPDAVPQEKDKYRVKVERILEQNLWDMYFALPQGAREKFKAEGENAAAVLRGAIETKKVKPSQVLHAVHKWLKTIPKVNPYFLEQEAKIKTDQVMDLVQERRKEEGLE
ncbi:MAG TPA: hypothetical protein VL426_07720 [Candidatus Binatia bacterium]|jgi:hypothetical protein|nr:hypothetical protein [Candidatus Binatia bacterium]